MRAGVAAGREREGERCGGGGRARFRRGGLASRANGAAWLDRLLGSLLSLMNNKTEQRKERKEREVREKICAWG